MLTHSDAKYFAEQLASIPPVHAAEDFEKDGILHCGKCGEPKQAWIDWFPDENGNREKRLVRIMCRCDMEQEALEKDRIAQTDFDDAMRKVRLALHTQRDDVRWRFDQDSEPGNPIARTCRKYVQEWDAMKKDNMGILFYGSKGSGKTFYASCIYNALKEKRVLVGFTSAPNLMNILSQWDKTEIFEALKRAHLLVIDDLGAERGSDYSSEQIYAVIDARYKTGKPTIVTTNIDFEDMKRDENMMRSRIYDRVIEMCPIAIPMTGQSRRGAIADARKLKARELLDWTKEKQA